MCSNYRPPTPDALLRLGRGLPGFEYHAEGYPERIGPFLANEDSAVWRPGTFGLLPVWAPPTLARHTYNARSETVAEKPSFGHAWKTRQLAIVPVQSFYEPNYESGKPVRWRIEREDQAVFGLAGIWEGRPGPNGDTWWSYSMLTINADAHPLMRRFHRPDDEKRSVVVLADDAWDAWLNARSETDVRSFLQLFDPGAFRTEADPKPGRTRM